MTIKRDTNLEAVIEKAISQITIAQREMYSNPKFTLKALDMAQNNIQDAYIRIVKRSGGKVKE